ncbi:MAG: hypothetical protein L3J45_04790 [Flavobacteriaceae bacterium]|nr:hypothetical protein [Flavobacteriaceae bacterium]
MKEKNNNVKLPFKLIGLFLITLILNACVDNNVNKVKVTKPEHTITKQRAMTLSRNYTARYDSVSRIIGKKDNRSIRYSLKELKQYIAYIEAEGTAKGYKVDGIRFYLGAYSKEDKNPKKQSYTTVFLVPTGVKEGTVIKSSAPPSFTSPDITNISPLNEGSAGDPPSATYPQ